MGEGYLIGVDGGGTKTKAVAARMDGTVLATAVGGGLNAGQIGAGRAKENLLGVLKRLTRELDGQAVRVVVGDPSLDGPASPSAARAFARGWIEPERLTLTSDVHLALFAFSQGAPAAMAVCGTGSMIVMTDENGETRTATPAPATRWRWTACAPPSTAGRACRTRGRWLNAHRHFSSCARRAL